MEKFKIDIFESENKNVHFPSFQRVSKKDCAFFKLKFAEKAGLNGDENDSVKILKLIRDKSELLPNINSESNDFNFKLLINKLQILEPENININWNRFEDIDKFNFNDFSNNLRYIWYAGPDDIEIFPNDVSWIISIDATGSVYISY